MSTKSTVLRCLNCGEFISVDAERCRFCSVPVDRATAEVASEVQGKANEAYSGAVHLRNIATGGLGIYIPLSVYLMIRYTNPETEKIALALLVFTTPLCALAILVLLLLIVRWKLKFARSRIDNPDMQQAKSAIRTAFISWCVLCAVWFFLGLYPLLLQL